LKIPIGKVLSIDYGSRRIGIALSDKSNTIAFGREVIPNNSEAVHKILDIIRGSEVCKIVLGYPLSLKGEKTSQTCEVEKFQTNLEQSLERSRLGYVEIVRWDERLTTKAAKDSMLRSGMRKIRRREKANIDIISAAILLQSYLDSRRYS